MHKISVVLRSCCRCLLPYTGYSIPVNLTGAIPSSRNNHITQSLFNLSSFPLLFFSCSIQYPTLHTTTLYCCPTAPPRSATRRLDAIRNNPVLDGSLFRFFSLLTSFHLFPLPLLYSVSQFDFCKRSSLRCLDPGSNAPIQD